jgi:hypothetical protein
MVYLNLKSRWVSGALHQAIKFPKEMLLTAERLKLPFK